MNKQIELNACITSLLLLGTLLVISACQKENDSNEEDAGTDVAQMEIPTLIPTRTPGSMPT